MTRLRHAFVLFLGLLDAGGAALGAGAVTRYDAPEAGIASPEMAAAVERMFESGRLEGRTDRLSHFRWSGDPLPKLVAVTLRGPKVDDDLAAMMSATPDLLFVSLLETHVSDAGIRAVAALPNIRSLTIGVPSRFVKPGFALRDHPVPEPRADRPRVTGRVIPLFAGSATLESLDLMDAVLAPGDLAGLADLPRLGSLALPVAVDDETLRALQGCRRADSLTLGHREIMAADIARLADWKRLHRLVLVDAALSDEALAALTTLETVAILELVECRLTDARLAALRLPPRLKRLSLACNEIAGPGLEHLLGANLQTLQLDFNDLDDDALAILSRFTTLDHLILEHCERVTDRGIRAGALQGMTHLQELRLRGMRQVTDAALDDLARFGHLKTISIRNTGITEAGRKRMQEAMPATNVFR